MEAETGVMDPQVQESHQLSELEAKKGAFPLESPREIGLVDILILAL